MWSWVVLTATGIARAGRREEVLAEREPAPQPVIAMARVSIAAGAASASSWCRRFRSGAAPILIGFWIPAIRVELLIDSIPMRLLLGRPLAPYAEQTTNASLPAVEPAKTTVHAVGAPVIDVDPAVVLLDGACVG